MALGQSLQQRLQQKLSPQQIQLMKLLQVTTSSLEQRIKEELEENPALELGDEGHDEKGEEVREEFEEKEEFEEEDQEREDPWEDIDLSEYTDDDNNLPEYKEKDNNYPELPEGRDIVQSADLSFNDILLEQLHMQIIDEREQEIAEHILGSIDDDGYLRRETTSIVDDLAFRQNIITSEKEVEHLIKVIQQFEPAGIAARDLQECLLLQLYRKQKELDTHFLDVAIEIIEHHFEEFSKKHFEKIQRSMNLSDEELKNSIQLILKLSPKPAGNLGDQSAKEGYVIPDFFIYHTGGKLELSLNSLNAPELRVSEDFKDMLKDYEKGNKKDKDQKDAVMFIKQKLDSAKWFIDAIKQRQNTLYNTMFAILQHQKAFFMTGDQTELKPMILKDIAEKT
ncbi:MAG: RNA polymerase factor sigma-54, partial [Chitinophagaceae bacterium]